MKNLDTDELLAKLGLERKPSVGESLVGALVPFGVGLLVGAGLALLLAPKSGRELREDIRGRLRRERGQAEEGHDVTAGTGAADPKARSAG